MMASVGDIAKLALMRAETFASGIDVSRYIRLIDESPVAGIGVASFGDFELRYEPLVNSLLPHLDARERATLSAYKRVILGTVYDIFREICTRQ